MKGFHVAQAGHPLPLYNSNATGGATTPAFSLEGAAHVSILIAFTSGLAAAPTSIVLNQCTDKTGANATPIPFNLFAAETPSSNAIGLTDSFGSRIAVPATGYVPAARYAPSFYVIEVDASELNVDDAIQTTANNGAQTATFGALPGFAYLSVTINAAANATPVAIFAILSGLRNESETQASALT